MASRAGRPSDEAAAFECDGVLSRRAPGHEARRHLAAPRILPPGIAPPGRIAHASPPREEAYLVYHAVAQFPLSLALKQIAFDTLGSMVLGVVVARVNR
jgi:hypothetical protein